VLAAHPRILLGLSAVGYAATTTAFIVLERPGLGVGHFFYIPILLLAVATGPVAGALGGMLATVLYIVGIYVNPHVPSTLEALQTLMRLSTFAIVGGLVGWFARDNRRLVHELERLASRDALTGLPNTRAFEAAIDRRLAAGETFALLVGDVDALAALSDGNREIADDLLRRLADVLSAAKRTGDDVARIGDDEFAILSRLHVHDARTYAGDLERLLALSGVSVTFGWATHPRDAATALGLYRAAEERLYTRKITRGHRRGTPQLAAGV
jgi:diguanylate cyclase (GGDEF)-like protein